MKQALIEALKEGNLYDFMANNYHKFSKEELVYIIKELDFALWDIDKSMHVRVANEVVYQLSVDGVDDEE